VRSRSGGVSERTLAAFGRIDTALVVEIALAYVENDDAFLERIGVDRASAHRLHALDTGTAAAIARAMRGTAFRIRANEPALANLVGHVSRDSLRQAQAREIVKVGATEEMCHTLGFAISEADYDAVRRRSRYPIGRPRKLTPRELESCERYWRAIEHPERFDPIEILISTCNQFGIRAASVWLSIGPAASGLAEPLARYSLHVPPGERPWVRLMFPQWADPAP